MLEPLPYHRSVTALLARENPRSFATLVPGSSAGGSGPRADDLDQALLRRTYRLDAGSHPDVHAAVAGAAGRLGISVPVELYAGEADGRNAELVYVPGRPVVVLTGGVLDLLTSAELTAVAGHELAHYALWSGDGHRVLAAARLLDTAETDARTPPEYLETARRFRLATELFADRGALLACGDLEVAVAALLKMSTGLSRVDPAAYLHQAAEVALDRPSSGHTHPETVLRCWALQQWHERGSDAEEDVERALSPELDLGTIDVTDQDRLVALTTDLVRSMISVDLLRTDLVLELAERYGVPAGAPPPWSAWDTSALSADTRRYLAAILLDLATADPDLGAEALDHAMTTARRFMIEPDLTRLADAETGSGTR